MAATWGADKRPTERQSQEKMNLVLKVPYKGKAMMVGKVFTLRDEQVFYHEHTSTQYFRSIPSLPIDWAVLSFLTDHNVVRVDYLDKDHDVLRTTTLQTFSRRGIRLKLDTRDRVFLPLGEWNEIQKNYDAPYITLETVIDA